ncbi:MAG: RNA methyltransferase [Azospirillaceae bacterium]
MAGTNRKSGDAADHILPGPAIVLVEPQLGENIGASARAMLNFGLGELRLVSPRDGWPSAQAVASSSGALAVLERARVFATTADAVADCHDVWATTARPRHVVKPVLTPREAAARMAEEVSAGRRVAVLFGGERAGLCNDDISLATRIVSAPLNPAFSSLNLAQAVLLVAAEYAEARPERTPSAWPEDSPPSTAEERERLLQHLELALDATRFFTSPEKKPSMLRNLRAIFTRADLTRQEVRTLHGVISALADMRADGRPA